MQPNGRDILVVDDAPENRLLLRVILERNGYRVALAEDGEQALEAVAAALPDLIVLDLMMPGIDGTEVARRLRRQPRSAAVPILMLSASPLDEHVDAALAAGATDYLTKPVDRQTLTARVAAMLRGRTRAAR